MNTNRNARMVAAAVVLILWSLLAAVWSYGLGGLSMKAAGEAIDVSFLKYLQPALDISLHRAKEDLHHVRQFECEEFGDIKLRSGETIDCGSYFSGAEPRNKAEDNK